MKRISIPAALIILLNSLPTHAGGSAGLLEAVRANDLAQVQKLTTSDMLLTSTDPAGNTALMVAAACGYVEVAHWLVDHGAAVDARGYIGNTALIYAAQEGHAEIARLLLAHGADPAICNQYGNDAVNLAAGLGGGEVLQVLKPCQTAGQPAR